MAVLLRGSGGLVTKSTSLELLSKQATPAPPEIPTYAIRNAAVVVFWPGPKEPSTQPAVLPKPNLSTMPVAVGHAFVVNGAVTVASVRMTFPPTASRLICPG